MRRQVMAMRLAVILFAGGCASGSPTGDTGSSGDPVEDLSARLHPSLGSVVYVSWNQVRETESVLVSYGFDEGIVETTPPVAGTLGTHEQIVLGVPYGATLDWSVDADEGAGTHPVAGPPITTDDAPADLPVVTLDLADAARWDPAGRYLLTSISEYAAFMTVRPEFWLALVDRQGRYVWAQALDPTVTTLYAKPARDGAAILYDASTWWTLWDLGAASEVRRILLDGTEERTWATSGLAHAFDDLSADTVAWFASPGQGDTLEKAREGGAPEVLWRCQDWILASDLDPTTACFTNAVFWNEDRGTWIFSVASHETVAEWDEAADEVIWYSDPNEGHGYTLTAGSPAWHWQHEPKMLGPDRLLLSSGVDVQTDGSFRATAAYEYAIDHDARTLDLVWSYEAEPEFTARYKGGAERLANGNTLQFYGNSPAVKEIAPDGTVVWQARFASRDEAWIGRSTWLDDLYAFAPGATSERR